MSWISKIPFLKTPMLRTTPLLTPYAHPESDRLLASIRVCSSLVTEWVGVAYRVVAVGRANEEDLLSGEGSRIWGGRWNPAGVFRVVYLSLDRTTAMDEYLAQNSRNGLPDYQALPAVTIGVQLALKRVLDLTIREVQNELALTTMAMTIRSLDPSPLEYITQAVGRLAWSEGHEGLIVPSAERLLNKNIAVFPERLRVGQMSPINVDQLPKKDPTGR
jgi:RES domain-containing protein